MPLHLPMPRQLQLFAPAGAKRGGEGSITPKSIAVLWWVVILVLGCSHSIAPDPRWTPENRP
jgi:hypothetical protein